MKQCITCEKYATCREPCDWLLMALKDRGVSVFSHTIEYIDNIDSAIGMPQRLSEEEKSRLRYVFVTLLRPQQKRVFELYSSGKTQGDIAVILGISQQAVSKALKGVKKSIKSQFLHVIDSMIR